MARELRAAHGGQAGEPGDLLRPRGRLSPVRGARAARRRCSPARSWIDAGALVGTHVGIGAYTVGQRKGLGIAAPEPTYVDRIDPRRNLLVVGPERLLYSGGGAAPKTST